MKLPFLPNYSQPARVKFLSRASTFFAAIAALIFVAAPYDADAQFTFVSDTATNSAYGDGWQNGDDGGLGLAAWSITGTGANSGNFIGNPSNDGMGTTGIGTTAFGLYANTTNSGYVNATRSFDNALGVGDTFSFYWAINWDTGNSSNGKGFDLRSGSTTIFNVGNGNDAGISIGGVTPTIFNSSSYGTTPMLVTVAITTNGFTFTMSTRTNSAVSYTTNVVTSSNITGFNLYAGNQQSGGQRNPYYDDFLSTNSGVFTQGGSVTNANTFTGTGNLSVGNSTTLALSGGGNNNYSGTTTISNGSTLRFQGSGTSAFGSAISGGGAIVVSNGSGQVNLSANNSGFSGNITITNGTIEAQNANALGDTTGTTTVGAGAALKLFNAGNMSMASEVLTLNGTGVNNNNGALRSVGGTNTWNGAITLGSNSRINADTTGGAGSLTIAGNVTGGANVLFLGADGANITLSGALSGAGASQDSTTTSIFKDGANTLTLSGNNSYTGDTRVTAGNVTVAAGGNLGSGSDVFVSLNASLTVNTNTTIASLQETGNNNGGTATIGTGATLTINGADKGNLFQNSISGSGNLTLAASGTTVLSLYGSQTYTGATTVSGGTLSTSVALGTSGLTVSGGIFETTAANILADGASVTVNGGQYTVGGSDTIGALSGSGGTISLGNSTLTTSSASSTTYSGTIAGTGGLTKSGSGTLTLSGNNSHSGAATVSAGTLQLNRTGGASLGSVDSITVNDTATLLISQSNQVNNANAEVTLSGGTITRASGVSEVFGNLNLTAESFLDFGSGAVGTIAFGTYTPSALTALSIANFTQGNTLTFKSNLTSSIETSAFEFTGSGGLGGYSWNNETSTFTITAIPEPSTYVAAAGLLALFLWPARRRLLKDAKSILGLRPTGRDRIEAYRQA